MDTIGRDYRFGTGEWRFQSWVFERGSHFPPRCGGVAMSFGFRRSAEAYRVPCITTMSGARAAADAVAARVRDPIRVWSLQEIHARTVA